MQSVFSGISEACYKMFWQKCGTHGLTLQQKIDALCKLRDLSLRLPYWNFNEITRIGLTNIEHFCTFKNNIDACQNCDHHKNQKCAWKPTLTEMFPEPTPQTLCKKHVHLTKLTGLLLYTMHTELFKEIKELAQNGKLTQAQIEQIGDF